MANSGLVGQTIVNRYFVRSLIGQGGMGQVYIVWDRIRAVELAMKVLRDDLTTDANFLRRFEREATTLSRLQHPNIVRSYEYQRSGNISFILTDLVKGISLKEVIRKKTFSIKDFLQFLEPISKALYYAHSSGFIHGDVKPGNILINERGDYFLTDFGLSRIVSEPHEMFAGTPAYMAPEQIKGERLSYQSDIFSLGVVSFELLTGLKPFDIAKSPPNLSTVEKSLYATLNFEPLDLRKYNPSLSANLVRVLNTALEKDPKDRYASVMDFYDEIRNAAAASMITVDHAPALPAGNQNDKEDGETKLKILIPLKPDFRFVSQPLEPDQVDLLIGRGDDVEQFSNRLMYSDGGAFLVAGYRGTGKTSFVNQVVETLRLQMADEHNDQRRTELVVVKLNIPKPISPVELMYLIINGIHQKLQEMDVLGLLDRSLIDKIALAIQRISTDLQQKMVLSDNLELGGTLGSSASGGISASAKKNKSYETVKTYRDYHVSAAEQDLLFILSRLNKPIVYRPKILAVFRRKPITIRLKTVIIFDELDRIDDHTALTDLLTSLKTLFTTSGVSFIFVGGKDIYLKWLSGLLQPDSAFEGIFSGYDHYLPCLWDDVPAIMNTIVDSDETEWELLTGNITDPDRVYADFLGYLSFKGRGLPRRIHRAFSRYVIRKKSQAYFGFTRKDMRRFRFYTELYEWIRENETKTIKTSFDSSSVENDTLRILMYSLLDWILYHGSQWFTQEDILKAHDEIADGLRLSSASIKKLLQQLVADEYLETSSTGYRLSYRRFIEIGERPEKILPDESIVEKTDQGYPSIAYKDVVDDAPTGSRMLAAPLESSAPVLVNLTADGNKIRIAKTMRAGNIVVAANVISDKLDIGRSQENDVQITDELVSRYHARIIFMDGNWYIFDMNTVNNTLLNDIPVQGKQSLFSGDTIQVGSVTMAFQLQ